MTYLWIALVASAAVFPHCLGMCGPFALHLSGGTRRAAAGRMACWLLGKTVTYVFLGALAGFAGQRLTQSLQQPWVQDAISYVAGGTMILMALPLLGLMPRRWRSDGSPGLLGSMFQSFFASPRAAAALPLGIACGFLPCPIVIAFLAWSLHMGSVAAGMGVMAAVGVGTAWSLLGLAMTGQMIRQALRRWAAPVSGIILIVMGLGTMFRGSSFFHQALGCPHKALKSMLPVDKPALPSVQRPVATTTTSNPRPTAECCGGHENAAAADRGITPASTTAAAVGGE